MAEKAAVISATTGRAITTGAGEHGSFVYRDLPITLLLLPQERYANTAQRAFILVRSILGCVRTLDEARRSMYVIEDPKLIADEKAKLLRLPDLGWCWEWRKRVLPPTEVADALIESALRATGAASSAWVDIPLPVTARAARCTRPRLVRAASLAA